MLKGTREVIVRKIQPISIHGQISWDISFNDPDDPDAGVSVARVGPETVVRSIEPGDRAVFEYVLGSVVSVRRA